MPGYSIALSGLEVARQAIQIIGNNIANAATEGYHRQAPVIQPIPADPFSGLQIGRGAEVINVERLLDSLLEREIRRQQPELGQVSQEVVTLEALESLLGDLDVGGLSGALNRFFAALGDLASQPDSVAFREEVIGSASAVAAQFRALGNHLIDLEDHVVFEAQNLAEQADTLARQIADSNLVLQGLAARGSSDSNLLDQRDRAAAQLAELVDVGVYTAADGSYTVYAWGTPIVLQTHVTEIEVGYIDAESIGVSAKETVSYDPTLRGGRIGALLALRNDLLPRIRQELDTLANEIIQRINRYHVQGVGTAGSFDELTGWVVGNGPLAEWQVPVTAGDLSLRVINTATGEVTRHTVTIAAPATQTAADIAAVFGAVPHLSAQITDACLHVEAEEGYRFDFAPALAPAPSASTLTGTAAPTLSGVYRGSANRTLTCTVVGTGEVGVTADLAVEVRDASGALVRTLRVGAGYAAGDPLEVVDGVFVSFSAGTLNAGETFTAEALVDTDPTGFLAAAGLNALFAGTSADSMEVAAGLRESPLRLATGLGEGQADNLNVLRLAGVADERVAALGDSPVRDAYRSTVAAVGQWVALRRARQEGLEHMLTQLSQQRDEVSSVDVNEEGARLLIFERMFQGMARYLAAVDRTQQMLLELV